MTRRNGRLPKSPAVIISVFIIALAAIFILYEPNSASHESPASGSEAQGVLMSYFIDVGQGDCELVRIPRQDGSCFNMLIDSGEASRGDNVIDTLHELGVEKLDAVVVSHPHADHMGSMAAVIENFTIDAFYMPEVPEDQTPTTLAYERMIDALIEKEMKIHLIKAGDVISGTDAAVINVLAPNKGDRYENMNNYSAVIKITYGETSFIYMGDAETGNFEAAMDSGYNLDADVLKVGHHGSGNATNKALLQAVSPDIAVISCGKGNDYGHPHKETLNLLKNNKVEVLRTDRLGTIVIESDGKNLITA